MAPAATAVPRTGWRVWSFVRDLLNTNPSAEQAPAGDDGKSPLFLAVLTAIGTIASGWQAATQPLVPMVAGRLSPAWASLATYAILLAVIAVAAYMIAAKRMTRHMRLDGAEQCVAYRYTEVYRSAAKAAFAVMLLLVAPLVIYTDFVLPMRLPAVLSGKVVCSDSGAAVAGAALWIKDSRGATLSAPSPTDDDGIFYATVVKSPWVPYVVVIRTTENRTTTIAPLRTLRFDDGWWMTGVGCGT